VSHDLAFLVLTNPDIMVEIMFRCCIPAIHLSGHLYSSWCLCLAYIVWLLGCVVDALSAILLVGMMFVQNVRRLLECFFVSVYSKSTMNILHFMLGVILYSTFFVAVLVEAPSPTSG